MVAPCCIIASLLAPSVARAGLPLLGPIPEFTIPAVDSAPVLDGKLDDDCWRQALTSTEFYESDQPGEVTTLYLARHGRTLLVGMDCRAKWEALEGQRIAVYLDTMHIHDGPPRSIGVTSDGKVEHRCEGDPVWEEGSPYARAAVARSGNAWSVELAIDLTEFPYVRSHDDAIGLFIARDYLPAETRLVWARRLKSTEGYPPPYLAPHVRGLDLPGMFAEIDAENEAALAPLAARAAKLHAAVGKALADTTLPPEARLRVATLAAWIEEMDAKRRECVERVSLQGLAEWEQYVRDAEALAGILTEAEHPPADLQSTLGRRAADARGPAVWEANVTASTHRFGRKQYNLGLLVAGIPIAAISETVYQTAEDLRQWQGRIDAMWREAGLPLTKERREEFEVAVASDPIAGRRIAYPLRGLATYNPVTPVSGGEQLLLDALVAEKPFTKSLADALWSGVPVPVRTERVSSLLAFPVREATAVLPAHIPAEDVKQIAGLRWALAAKQSAVAMPASGPAIVYGWEGQEAALRAAGFNPAPWSRGSQVGRVAFREESGRPIVGLWGRTPEDLQRAAQVFADLRAVLADREVLVGDLHLHSVLSDGSGSPRQVILECIASGMDFAALTDHFEATGSCMGKQWAEHWVPGFAAIGGEEVMGAHFEILALGISRTVPTNVDAKQIVTDIHSQGGLALVCHAGGFDESEQAAGERLVADFDALGLDGFDRPTPVMAGLMEERDRAGRRFIVTGVTDDHSLTFASPLRTIVFAKGRSEQSILEALHSGYSLSFSPGGVVFPNPGGFQGPPRLRDVMLALVGERTYLEEHYRARAQQRSEQLLRAWQAGAL
jgi:hypothetical protein